MTDTISGAGFDLASTRDERAQKAVKAFRALQPTLSAYARVYTGKKSVRVEISSQNAHTDGDRIYIRPPMELGDLTPHVRKLCDKRDEIGRMRCDACRIREGILIEIYHEIAHMTEGTFEKVSKRHIIDAVQKSVDENGTKYAEQIRTRILKFPEKNRTYLSLSGNISPFLPLIVNSLEDARVNNRLFEARRGTRVMFDSFMAEVFSNGVEQTDPTTGQTIVKLWKDYPLNAQIVTGFFCVAAGYRVDSWFDQAVVSALADEKLSSLLAQATTCKWAGDTYELAFPVLARARELGFLKSEKDPEPEPEPEQPEEQSDEQESESDETSDGGGDSGDASEDSSEDESGREDEGSDSGADAGEEGSEDRDDQSESEVDDEADQDSGNDMSDGDGSEDESDGNDGQTGSSESDSSEPDTNGNDDASSGQSEEDNSQSDGQSSGDSQSEGGGIDESSESENQSPKGSSSGDENSGEATYGAGDGESKSDVSNGNPQDESSAEGSSSESVPSDSDLGDSNEVQSSDDRDDVDSKEGLEGNLDRSESHDQDREQSDSEVRDERRGDQGPEELGSSDDSEWENISDVEAVDSGADEGKGGTILDDKEMGTVEEVKSALESAMMHGDKPETMEAKAEEKADNEALKIAIIQGLYFETPSVNVTGVRINQYGKDPEEGSANAWDRFSDSDVDEDLRRQYGASGEFDPDESVLGPALLKMRRVFADNRRGSHQKNLKSGRINTRALGRRAPTGDERLFKHTTQPGKKDYAVVIGMDISGSTVGRNISLEKRAVMAQANLLARMGIDFAIVAHSAYGSHVYSDAGAILDIYMVKDFNEPWSEATRSRLREIGPYSGNLDGHALEFMRKLVERTSATDKVLMYYSDGKMPAMNHDEELDILQREIRLCNARGIALLGVGIRTDSPSRHGLDTVEVEEDRDIEKVVKHLEKHLS